MKILAPGFERNDTGGGSTFLQNLAKALKPFGHEVHAIGEYDILLIAGASLCERSIVENAQKEGKPIVLRIDNILEDRKNRNGGMAKLKEYAKAADVIVYQSEWAKRFLEPIVGRSGMVIKNGVDTDIFYPEEGKVKKSVEDEHVFLYSKFSRGEGKHFEVVQQWWREHSLYRPQDTLLLVGRFADDYRQSLHPFEFHNNERFQYLGITTSQEEMAEWFRLADCAILPYFADACSNTILEAQACGLYTIFDNSGGTKEIMFNGEQIYLDIHERKDELIERIDKGTENFYQNFDHFKEAFGLEHMAAKYSALFQTIKESNNEVEI